MVRRMDMQSREFREQNCARMRQRAVIRRKREDSVQGWLNTGSAISTMVVAGIALLVLSCGDSTVEPLPPVATTVAVDPGSASLTALGETVRFTAEVHDQNGQVMAGTAIGWTSSDASVAPVDASGMVTAAANGSATITATAGEVSSSATVTVAQTVAAVEVAPGSATLTAFGDTLRLTAEASDANGHAVAGFSAVWSSGAPDVAVVDPTGLLTARSNGQATLTAMAGNVSGSATVTVAQTVAAVDVAPGSATLTALGDTLRLTAEASDANGHAVAGLSAVWSSGAPDVAVVGSTGLLTARSNGTAMVTATADGVWGSATVTVAQTVAAVAVAPGSATLTALGDTLRLTAEVSDANGHAVVGVDPAVWSSGAPDVAMVDPTGLLTARSNGQATLTAMAGNVSGSATVTVAQTVAALEVAPGSATLTALGDTLRLTVEARDANGHAVAGLSAVWSSGAPDVAVVGSTGLLTARSNGTATVTATADDVSGSATVTVAQTVAAVDIAPGSATLTALGDTLRLTAEVSDANGHAVVGVPAVWSSGAPDVAAVGSNGLLTARSNGATVVTAVVGAVSGSATVTVAQAVAAIVLDRDAMTLTALGFWDGGELWARVTDANGNVVVGVPVAWSSDADSVAAVESAITEGLGPGGRPVDEFSFALVTTGWEGSATVTATAGGVSASAFVTVLSPHCEDYSPAQGTDVRCRYDVVVGMLHSPLWGNPAVITAADPSGLDSVVYAGREPDRYLFTAHFGRHTMEVKAHPAYATADRARVAARFFASAIGRLPRFLIHGGREMEISPSSSFGAGANPCGDSFHWEGTPSSWMKQGVVESVEEVALHEAGHVVLDSCASSASGMFAGFSLSPGWLAAQRADGMFISGYAKANPRSEDVAETLWAWFVSRCVPGRLHPAWKWYIDRGIPHRLAFMDRVFATESFDTSPYVCGVGS